MLCTVLASACWFRAAAALAELAQPGTFRLGAVGLAAVAAMADQENSNRFLTLSRKVCNCQFQARLVNTHGYSTSIFSAALVAMAIQDYSNCMFPDIVAQGAQARIRVFSTVPQGARAQLSPHQGAAQSSSQSICIVTVIRADGRHADMLKLLQPPVVVELGAHQCLSLCLLIYANMPLQWLSLAGCRSIGGNSFVAENSLQGFVPCHTCRTGHD